MNVVMAPMWICSGIFFAASNFPDPLQPFIQALPLTALVDALRSVMLDGNGLLATGPELLILAAWCGELRPGAQDIQVALGQTVGLRASVAGST